MNIIPYVIEQTGRGERSYDIYSRLLSDRIISPGEEVSDISASLTITQLLSLKSTSLDKDIQLHINSPGGSVTAGQAVYDTMQYTKRGVSTICLGLAASFGAFLLAGGAYRKRMALPNSEIVIHQPAIHGNRVQGPASDIEIMSDYMQKSRQHLNRVLAVNTGRSEEEIARDTERDNFISTEEALEYGLIDSILTRR